MADVALNDGQYSIDEFVFGANTNLPVTTTVINPGSLVTQDVQLVANDGRIPGVDWQPGMSLTFTGQALITGAGPTALDNYDQMVAAWNRLAIRGTPGALSILRCRYPGSSVTRRTYGRGRSIAPTLGAVRQGWVGFVAEFDSMDNTFYDDVSQRLVLGTRQATTGGVAPPLTPPVVLAAEYSTDNLLTPADSDFELPWTSNWKPLSLISSMGVDSSNSFTGSSSMAVVITAAGTAQFVYGPTTPVIANVPYEITLEDLGLGGSISVTATCFDFLGNVTGTLSVITADSDTIGTWNSAKGTFTPPTGTVRFQLSVSYAAPSAGTIWIDTVQIFGGSKSDYSVLNTGSLPTWPIITITGPVTNPKISYPGSSINVSLQTSLASGQSVTIFTMPWYRAILGSIGVGAEPGDPTQPWAFSSLAGTLRGSPIDNLILPLGQTVVNFTGQDLAGSSRCIISWRNAWSMIGGSS